jgi:hypothetical protein
MKLKREILENKLRTIIRRIILEETKNKPEVQSIKLKSGYTLKIKRDDSILSNFTVFASIWKGSEKLPLFGTTFKTDVTDEEMIHWAEKKINTYPDKTDIKLTSDDTFLKKFK